MPYCSNNLCRRKGKELHNSQFYLKSDRKSGVCSWCIECMKLYSKVKSNPLNGYKNSKKGDKDDFLERAKEYNREHPFRRSDEVKKHIEVLKGTDERTVVI